MAISKSEKNLNVFYANGELYSYDIRKYKLHQCLEDFGLTS